MQTFLKHCRWGQFLLIRGDMISGYVDKLGHWADIEVDLFRALLPPSGGACIEVGSNIGMHAVPLSRLCEGGEVICYEPQRPVFHVLCANLALNNRLNVRTRHAAVGEKAGRIAIETGSYDQAWNYGSFSITKGFSNEGRFGGEVASEEVEIAALDSDPALAHLERLDLLKVDAEGHELAVLKGAKGLIKRFQPSVFVEPSSRESVDSLKAMMGKLGYRGYWFAGQRYGPDDRFAPQPGSSHHDVNLLFRPEGDTGFGLPELTGGMDLDPPGVPILASFGPGKGVPDA
ncbi:MAG: FkbM family methyltransferase [Novosphingobium sp.]